MNENALLQHAKDLAKDLAEIKIQTSDLSPLLRGHLMRIVTAYKQGQPAAMASTGTAAPAPNVTTSTQDQDVDDFVEEIDEALDTSPWAAKTLEGIRDNVRKNNRVTEDQRRAVFNIANPKSRRR